MRAFGLFLLAAGAALVAFPGRPAVAQEIRYTRSLEVPAPLPEGGWVRVPLAPEVLRRSGSGAGLRLFDPQGQDVPFRRVPAEEAPTPSPPSEQAPAEQPEGAAEEAPEGGAGRSFRLLFPRPDCGAPGPGEPSPASPRRVCRLTLDGAGRFLRRLCFTTEAGAPAGHRLLAAEEGRWAVLGEAVWDSPGEESRRCIPLELTLSDPAGAFRLELYGGGGEVPAVRGASAEFLGEDLLFRSSRPGLHTLAYGPGVVRSSHAGELEIPDGVEPVTVVPGPEEAAEVPAPGPALPAASGPASPVAFDETWRVTADDPESGALHRLVLPPEVYPVAAPDLADLRLIVTRLPSQLQVPSVRWRPAEPILVVARRGVEPVAGDDGVGRVELEVPSPGLPLSALVVSVAPGAFGPESATHRVRVLVVEPAPGGNRGGTRPVTPWTDWECRPRPPLPCRMTIPLNGSETRRSRRLVLEVDSRQAAATSPPVVVDVELWRLRDVLLFAWPGGTQGDGGEGPLLGAGASELEAPDHDGELDLDELLSRPWQEARVVPEGEGDGSGRPGDWAIALALLGAVAALLMLLHRILSPR